jgi:hypothetical protein
LWVRRKIGFERGDDWRQDAADTLALNHSFYLNRNHCPLSLGANPASTDRSEHHLEFCGD